MAVHLLLTSYGLLGLERCSALGLTGPFQYPAKPSTLSQNCVNCTLERCLFWNTESSHNASRMAPKTTCHSYKHTQKEMWRHILSWGSANQARETVVSDSATVALHKGYVAHSDHKSPILVFRSYSTMMQHFWI